MPRADHKYLLLKQWDYLCVVCGRPFANLACVTVEHLTPRSLGGKGSVRQAIDEGKTHSNLGPSHYRCNNRRGSRSLIRAADSIEREFTHLARRVGETSALQWLNKVSPCSPYSRDPIVPQTARMP